MNPQHKIIILQANTYSGKTEVSNFLESTLGIKEFHPYGFRKRQLENHYKCPNLDTQEGKNFIPDGMSVSMQELMVSEYHHYVEIDPFFTTRVLRDNLSELVDTKGTVCVVSIRNIPEVLELFKVLWAHKYTHEPYFIRINRPGYNGSTSDDKMERIWQLYNLNYVSSCFVVNNDSTLDSLFEQVKQILFPSNSSVSLT